MLEFFIYQILYSYSIIRIMMYRTIIFNSYTVSNSIQCVSLLL